MQHVKVHKSAAFEGTDGDLIIDAVKALPVDVPAIAEKRCINDARAIAAAMSATLPLQTLGVLIDELNRECATMLGTPNADASEFHFKMDLPCRELSATVSPVMPGIELVSTIKRTKEPDYMPHAVNAVYVLLTPAAARIVAHQLLRLADVKEKQMKGPL